MISENILTVKDLLDYLNKKVSDNPKVLNYQLARTECDDEYSCAYVNFTYACTSIQFVKLPAQKNQDEEWFDARLTSKKMLLIN